MRPHKLRSEQGGYAEETHLLRLKALLHELVRKQGRVETARTLGLDPRTVAACMDGRHMSWRVREALERAQREGLGSDTARTRHGDHGLELRVNMLEQKVREGVVEVRSEVTALGTDHSQALRQMERRLARMEDLKGVEDAGAVTDTAGLPATVVTSPSGARAGCVRGLASVDARRVGTIEQRRYPDLVTSDPMPGDAEVYGPVWPLVGEWRRLWVVHHDSCGGLSGLMREERIRELEVAMLEEHGLTLPPETEPLRGLWRSSQLDWRKRALNDLRRARAKRKMLRWVRRALTLGLWWE